jgi:hypothetical protein
MQPPQIKSEAVGRSVRSVRHLLAVLFVFVLAIGALSYLDELHDGEDVSEGDAAINTRLLRTLQGDFHEAGIRLVKRGQTSFADENALIEALGREAAVVASRRRFDKFAIELDAYDTSIAVAAQDARSAAVKERPKAFAYLSQLVQGRSSIALTARSSAAEAEADARLKAESLRGLVRAAAPRRADTGGVAGSLLKHFASNKHPMHLLYDIGWYTALLAAVLALVYLVWILILRALPFPGGYERFDEKIGDWLKREPSRGGGARAARALAALAVTAIGAATVAEGVMHYDSSPFNELSLARIGLESSNHETPPPKTEPLDTRDLLAELRQVRESVAKLDGTTQQAGIDVRTAVGEVRGGVTTLSDKLTPLADATPDIKSSLARTANSVTTLPEMNDHLMTLSGNTSILAGITAVAAQRISDVKASVEAVPGAVGTSIAGSTQAINEQLDKSQTAIETAASNHASDTFATIAVQASHTAWRRALWLEKYQVSSLASATLRRAVDNEVVREAVLSMDTVEPTYRTVFLDGIRRRVAAKASADETEELMHKYAPLILTVCRTAE